MPSERKYGEIWCFDLIKNAEINYFNIQSNVEVHARYNRAYVFRYVFIVQL
jgi:hypothetical protein